MGRCHLRTRRWKKNKRRARSASRGREPADTPGVSAGSRVQLCRHACWRMSQWDVTARPLECGACSVDFSQRTTRERSVLQHCTCGKGYLGSDVRSREQQQAAQCEAAVPTARRPQRRRGSGHQDRQQRVRECQLPTCLGPENEDVRLQPFGRISPLTGASCYYVSCPQLATKDRRL